MNCAMPFPNIIFTRTGDMFYGDLGSCTPGSGIPAPNATCTPTRYGTPLQR